MKPNLFIYLVSNLLLIQFIGLDSPIVEQGIYLICALGIASIGLAHGAIDNLLYPVKSGQANLLFILKYVASIFGFALFWWLIPNIAFVFFLAVSAYHFGQSQFAEYSLKPYFLSRFIYFFWGSSILLSMLFFNKALLSNPQLPGLPTLFATRHLIEYSGSYLILSLGVLVVSGALIATFNKLLWEAIFKEIYTISLIIISFYLLPAFVAFALFFVWIHSFHVMTQEYIYCKKAHNIRSHLEFLRLFIPLTLAALLSTGAIVLLLYQFEKTDWLPFALLVLLSCVTIPHAFVMESFYNVSQSNKD